MPVTLEDIEHLELLPEEKVWARHYIIPTSLAEIKSKDNCFTQLVYVAGRYENPSEDHFLICSPEKVYTTGEIRSPVQQISNLDSYRDLGHFED